MIIRFERRVCVQDVYVEVCEVVCHEVFDSEEAKEEWLAENHWTGDVLYDEFIDRNDSYVLEVEIAE